MPPSIIAGGKHCVFGSSVRPSVRPVSVRCPLTTIVRDALSLLTVKIFQ